MVRTDITCIIFNRLTQINEFLPTVDGLNLQNTSLFNNYHANINLPFQMMLREFINVVVQSQRLGGRVR